MKTEGVRRIGKGHQRKAIIMKYLMQLTGACLVILFGISPLQATDLKDGFMGTKWQTDLSQAKIF